MPKVIKHFLKTVLLIFVALTLNLLALPQPTYAEGCNIFQTDPQQEWHTGIKTINSITIGTGALAQGQTYSVYSPQISPDNPIGEGVSGDGKSITFSLHTKDHEKILLKEGSHELFLKEKGGTRREMCQANYKVNPYESGLFCEVRTDKKGYKPGENIKVEGEFWKYKADNPDEKIIVPEIITITLYDAGGKEVTRITTGSGKTGFSKDFTAGGISNPDGENWKIIVGKWGDKDSDYCSSGVWISATGSPPPGGGGPSGKNPCEGRVCKTALGDIPTDPAEFAKRILEIAVGLGGGLALILMVVGAIKVLTSTGDQQKLNAGRDMIVAAVAGLLFIIFSVMILRFIGVHILIGF